MSDTSIHTDVVVEGDWATVTVLHPADLPDVAARLLTASDSGGGVTTITGAAIGFRAPLEVVRAAGLDTDEPEKPRKRSTRKAAPAASTVTTTVTTSEETHR